MHSPRGAALISASEGCPGDSEELLDCGQCTMLMALGCFHLAVSCGEMCELRSRSCVDGSPACLAAQVISESMSAQQSQTSQGCM